MPQLTSNDAVVLASDKREEPQQTEHGPPNAGVSRMTLRCPRRPGLPAPPPLPLVAARTHPRIASVVRRISGQPLQAVRVGAVGDLIAIRDAIAVSVRIARAGGVDVVLIAIRGAVVVGIEIIQIGAQVERDRVLEPVSVSVQRIDRRRRWRFSTLDRRGPRLIRGGRRFLRDAGASGGLSTAIVLSGSSVAISVSLCRRQRPHWQLRASSSRGLRSSARSGSHCPRRP